MAAFDYGKMKGTAEKLLSRFGQAATLLKPGVPSGPAHNPGPAVPLSYACTVVVTDFSASERQGTEIEVTDRKVLVSTGGLPVAPATRDKITIGGKTFNVINVETLNPGGTSLLYTLQARL